LRELMRQRSSATLIAAKLHRSVEPIKVISLAEKMALGIVARNPAPMKLSLLILAILSIADPALASGVRPSDIAPIMIAPVFASGALGLFVAILLAKDREGLMGWVVGGAVFVLTIGMSRLLAGYGFFAALAPQVIAALVVAVLTWSKSTNGSL